MIVNIPLPCPECGGRMYSVGYQATIKILKNRTWHVCKECDFERDTEDFKRALFCV